MKTFKQLFRSLTLSTFLISGAMGLSSVFADGTLEISNDFELHEGQPLNVFTGGGLAPANPVFFDTSQTNPPEGRSSIKTQQTGGTFAFWGIFNVSTQNYTAFSNGHLRFFLKSTDTVRVEIEGPQGTKRGVDIQSTGGQWVEQVIPMSQFSGVQFDKIFGPFIYVTTKTITTHIDHIRWTKPVDKLVIFPSTTTANNGSQRQFTTEGRDTNDELVIVYSTYTTNQGSITPASPVHTISSTFTANSNNAIITATDMNKSTTAAVTVTTITINEKFGILSETVSGVNLDTDSFFGQFANGTGSTVTFNANDTSDPREGLESLAVTVNVTTSTGSAGVFIQWGLAGSASTVTRQMSDFYDGALRFWFKGPSALQDRLVVSVRSGNVDPDRAYSVVDLKNYTTFDGNWQGVSIPIKDFAGSPPWADLARTKVLFSIAAASTTSGSQTFHVDNVRWDTQTPGPVDSLTIVPSSVTVPLGAIRKFTAQVLDANKNVLDIEPTWSVSAGLGTISSTKSLSTILTASNSPTSGSVTASAVGKSTSATVTVASITFINSFNVYSDLGAGGFVGISTGGASGTQLDLTEVTSGGNPPEGTKFFKSTYTLVNSPGDQNAFALWFVESQNFSRNLSCYENGFLQFSVRALKDLEFGVRSDNITAGQEKSKYRLSELGIPLSSTTWTTVVLQLQLFKDREPNLQFDKIKTYFSIGGVSKQIGEVTDEVFDVDNVKWLASECDAADENKIYAGLKDKQETSGLVRSFDTLPQAFTYDQALAALNYTYRKDTALSKKVLDVYKDKFVAATFNGFSDAFHATAPATVLVSTQLAGPNAWLLISGIHYKIVVTTDTNYDAMLEGIADWLVDDLQDSDGAIRFGFDGATRLNMKSTEHNLDAFAALKSYGQLVSDSKYTTAANNVRTWLDTEAYDSTNNRFNVGELACGTPPNCPMDTRQALDVYSWPALALSSYTALLQSAKTVFRTTKTVVLTGQVMDGFDFTTDKDAVWVEGTGQMATAYKVTGSTVDADFFIQEIERAAVERTDTTQGLPYASNPGTGFGGFTMDALHPSASAAAWYLFAKRGINPFQLFPQFSFKIRKLSDNVEQSSVTWTANVPTQWVRSNEYIALETQGVTTDDFGIQIYTTNKSTSGTRQFVDLTPGTTNNLDSDPAGLLLHLAGETTTHVRLPMAWSISDQLGSIPGAVNPNLCPSVAAACQWLFLRDKDTPALDLDGDGASDTTAFVNGETDSTVRNQTGIHSAQGSTFFSRVGPADFIVFQANFNTAAAQVDYKTVITLEYFTQ